MKKMLKVFAIALLMVSLMASVVLNANAEEIVEEVAEIVEEEAIAVEAPVVEEIVEEVAEEVVEETTEEAAVEEIVEEAVVEEAAEEIVEEEVIEEVVEEQVVETVERKASFTFSYDGDEVEYGDEIKLVAVLSGYENVDYELVWQYSTDNANWHDYATGNASYTISEENASWYWRLVVNTVEEAA